MNVPIKTKRIKQNNFKPEVSFWLALQSKELLGDYRILDRLNNIDPTKIGEDVI